mmetsp:Transcript_34059/g.75066  ORF Transcript_34059/g.75066 Transcript_34059/m.75066 type:complete len:207 (-) Transcript_34059:748-1368(-)
MCLYCTNISHAGRGPNSIHRCVLIRLVSYIRTRPSGFHSAPTRLARTADHRRPSSGPTTPSARAPAAQPRVLPPREQPQPPQTHQAGAGVGHAAADSCPVALSKPAHTCQIPRLHLRDYSLARVVSRHQVQLAAHAHAVHQVVHAQLLAHIGEERHPLGGGLVPDRHGLYGGEGVQSLHSFSEESESGHSALRVQNAPQGLLLVNS